jgi:hypothetical protein
LENMTHQVDLNTIGERLKKEAHEAGYKDGYNAAIRDMAEFTNSAFRKKHGSGFSDTPKLIDIRKKVPATQLKNGHGLSRPLKPDSLSHLLLEKIASHKAGISGLDLKGWVRAGKSQYARHPNLGKRVDSTLTRMKSEWHLIAKKDDGKWYSRSQSGNGALN